MRSGSTSFAISETDVLVFAERESSFFCAPGLMDRPYQWRSGEEEIIVAPEMSLELAITLAQVCAVLLGRELETQELTGRRVYFHFKKPERQPESRNLLIFQSLFQRFICAQFLPGNLDLINTTKPACVSPFFYLAHAIEFANLCASLMNRGYKMWNHDAVQKCFLFE